MVDPNSEGLAFYYKLNGADQYNEGDQWYIKDTSGRGMNGQSNKLINGTSSPLNFVDLDQPISVK